MELSAEEKQAILMSDEFHKFFDRSTRLIERAMCEDYQRYTLPTRTREAMESYAFPNDLHRAS